MRFPKTKKEMLKALEGLVEIQYEERGINKRLTILRLENSFYNTRDEQQKLARNKLIELYLRHVQHIDIKDVDSYVPGRDEE